MASDVANAGHHEELRLSSLLSSDDNSSSDRVDINSKSVPQKRKRTSPDDQATLEAAYQLDSKPDKTARLELVKQVALSEKEVQIWFQNRRQSSRRRSRPLLPHEIVQYQLARHAHIAPDIQAAVLPPSPLVGQMRPSHRISASDSLPQHASTVCVAAAGQYGREAADSSSNVVTAASIAMAAPSTFYRADAQLAGAPNVSYAAVQDSNGSSACGYKAIALVNNTIRQQPATGLPSTQSAYAAPRGKKSQSFVRLSMSSDGKACVTTKNGSSPSPPRAASMLIPPMDFNAALSVTGNTSAVTGSDGVRRTSRSSSGRSRDSRAWQFWCDKDARSELEQKAVDDVSGSAADAIGLLRSASGRRILGSVPATINSKLAQRAKGVHRTKLERRRGCLQRANTTLGRLQSRLDGSEKVMPKLKGYDSTLSAHVPGNDSDKENWSPSERDQDGSLIDGANARSSPEYSYAAPQGGRVSQMTTLREDARTGLHKSALQHDFGQENVEPEAGAPTAGTVSDKQQNQSTSSEDDLDCIQGLLSLSQGNWR
ncbi:hypothetical protein BAUCODRAFT_120297 [Baudoinia panamericana UAMH 10762]|uniref:Homeobox domain-containing protein n=1 Tax=Baudoinia panamericana (strain UAMH 10762) TaxID=717646 RepID=M2LWI5_BAUPA|nr:uncharacterized protein BAUCODRAFT_120297 [Baudoinia panamericana UAMH 10762]EMC99007.1 hypothetical protein BAUCODRAFT_120297 [Baudoinia panamericana UAMH 10762]